MPSPAFDINPTPTRQRMLQTGILEGEPSKLVGQEQRETSSTATQSGPILSARKMPQKRNPSRANQENFLDKHQKLLRADRAATIFGKRNGLNATLDDL